MHYRYSSGLAPEKSPNQSPQPEARQRILRAARTIFASHGPEGATVRKICGLAKANVASVNYHFGGKDGLYLSVLQSFLDQTLGSAPAGLAASCPPDEALRRCVAELLSHALGSGDSVSAGLSRLLTREFIQSSPLFFAAVFECRHQPLHNALLRAVRQLMPGAGDPSVQHAVASIVGQCLLFGVARKASVLLTPDPALEPGAIQDIAGFIMEFSLGGLGRMHAGPNRRGRTLGADQ